MYFTGEVPVNPQLSKSSPLTTDSWQIDSMNTVADRILWAMGRMGISQTKLERLSGMSRGSLSRVVNKHRGLVKPELIGKVARALRVRHEWLATGLGEIEATPAEALGIGDRYPNRALAIHAARTIGLHKDAIEQVASMFISGDTDLPAKVWFDEIDRLHDRLTSPFAAEQKRVGINDD